MFRVEFGVNKAGTGMYYDSFDISAQVTEDGVCGAFKALTEDVFFGNPGIAPACCKNIKMNEHDQLQVHVADKAQTVDSVHILCQVHANRMSESWRQWMDLRFSCHAYAVSAEHTSLLWQLGSNFSAGVHDGATEEMAECSMPEALGKWYVPSCTVYRGEQ